VPDNFGGFAIPPVNIDLVTERKGLLHHAHPHLNTVLKKGLTYGKDYFLVGPDLWPIFASYGGNMIERQLWDSPTDGKQVDVSLNCFELVFVSHRLFDRLRGDSHKLPRAWVQLPKACSLRQLYEFIGTHVLQ
jgi:hypothetical protein